jgi:hypothetical protein
VVDWPNAEKLARKTAQMAFAQTAFERTACEHTTAARDSLVLIFMDAIMIALSLRRINAKLRWRVPVDLDHGGGEAIVRNLRRSASRTEPYETRAQEHEL